MKLLNLCLMALTLSAFSLASRAVDVQFQDKPYRVDYITLPSAMPPSAGSDLIFVYLPATGAKFLCIPTDPFARASFDPDKQRFYRVDRSFGFINAFTTLDSTFVNLDGTFANTRTEAPLLQNTGQSTLESYPIPLDVETQPAADITLIDPNTLVYRTSETKIYDIKRDPSSFTLLEKAIPLSTQGNVAVEHDGVNDTLLLVQTQAFNTTVPATPTAITDTLRAYTRAGELFSELQLVNNPSITAYKGGASGIAVDPTNGDFYILDNNQIIAFRQRFPSVVAINPKSGSYKGGTTVTITGTLFPKDAKVFFDGIASPSVLVVSETQITCSTPPHAVGAVDVTITGTDISAPLKLSSAFSYINNAPIAILTASPDNGPVPLTVSFDISLSNDPDGSLSRRVIDFGDGSAPYVFPEGVTAVTHIYSADGTYKATLVVADDLQVSATDSKTIIVGTGGDDINAPLVLRTLSMKIVAPKTVKNVQVIQNADRITIKAEITLPENVELDDLTDSTFTLKLVGAAGEPGFETVPIVLDENAQYKQPEEKFTLKALTGRAAFANSYALTYTRVKTQLPGILDKEVPGRQTLYIGMRFFTALGRTLTFQKTGENKAVVNVKVTSSKTTLTLSRK